MNEFITIDIIQGILQSMNNPNLLLQFKNDIKKLDNNTLINKYYDIIQKNAILKEKFKDIRIINRHPMVILQPQFH